VNNKPKILLVEDEVSHQLIISSALKKHFDVVVASNFDEAKIILYDNEFSLALLDIMLTQGTGYDVCEFIKSKQNMESMPIIFITSVQDVYAKVKGFELGADDYITKPCDPLELRARISSKIEKAQHHGNVIFGGLIFDIETQTVSYKNIDQTDFNVDLTPIEFKLLYYLVKHKGQSVKREDLLSNIWGDETHVLERSVDTNVASIRKKLGQHFSQMLKSVHSVGYKMVELEKKAA
jgi:two-component system, OmpR family, phosphate regulon response regulator PhoB